MYRYFLLVVLASWVSLLAFPALRDLHALLGVVFGFGIVLFFIPKKVGKHIKTDT